MSKFLEVKKFSNSKMISSIAKINLRHVVAVYKQSPEDGMCIIDFVTGDRWKVEMTNDEFNDLLDDTSNQSQE